MPWLLYLRRLAVFRASSVFVSSLAPRIPTGPVMVLVATLSSLYQHLCAATGYAARWRRHVQYRTERRHHFLRAFIELSNKERRGTAVRFFTGCKTGMESVACRATWTQLARQTASAVTDSGILRKLG